MSVKLAKRASQGAGSLGFGGCNSVCAALIEAPSFFLSKPKGQLFDKLRVNGFLEKLANQNGFTIARTTMTAAAMPGTSFTSRNVLPDKERWPVFSFFA